MSEPQFASREDAENTRRALVAHAPERFCPLLRDSCRTDCVAFFEGEAYESALPSDRSRPWRVSAPGCTAAAIVGGGGA